MKKILYYFLFLALLLASCTEQEAQKLVEPNLYGLTTETQLLDNEYIASIEAFYDKGKEGYFKGQSEIDIYYKVFNFSKEERPAILISSGRTEAAIKYKELIFDLYKNGYAIYILDHRGQGLSGRMVEDPDMGYIDDFQFYVDDMKQFYDSAVIPNKHDHIFLLCHSMGGAIGMTYLEQYPNDFTSAAFSSPMLGLKPGVCGGAKLLEKDQPTYGLGEHGYDDDVLTFKKNQLTGSEVRYNIMNAAFEEKPKAKLGGASYHWVVKSCEQFEIINSGIDKIQTPFILFSAENEQIVNANAHNTFIASANNLNKECELHTIQNAQHELFVEKDQQRIETLNKVLKFFEKYN